MRMAFVLIQHSDDKKKMFGDFFFLLVELMVYSMNVIPKEVDIMQYTMSPELNF